ncbi:MAG: hypothetical protein ACT4QC_14750 [Planctomycetaceae bacterium]
MYTTCYQRTLISFLTAALVCQTAVAGDRGRANGMQARSFQPATSFKKSFATSPSLSTMKSATPRFSSTAGGQSGASGLKSKVPSSAIVTQQGTPPFDTPFKGKLQQNPIISSQTTGQAKKIAVIGNLTGAPKGPTFPTVGDNLKDQLKPNLPNLPGFGGIGNGGSGAGGSGSGSGGSGSGSSGSGSGTGGSGSGSGSGGGSGNGSGNCQQNCPDKCHNNWWFPWVWYGFNNCYTAPYCNTGFCGTTFSTCTAASYPVIVEQAPFTVSTPVNVEVVSRTTQASEETANNAESKPMELMLGGTYAIRGDAFGEQAGRMVLEVGELVLPVQVNDWQKQQVSFTLPAAGLAKPADATLHVAAADQKLAQSVAVRLLPMKRVAEN